MAEVQKHHAERRDIACVVKITAALLEPWIGLAVLRAWRPQTDLGELMAAILWPVVHFLVGLVVSSNDFPDTGEDTAHRISGRYRLRVYHYRLGWITTLTFFQFFGVIAVLAGSQGLPTIFWIVPVGLYFLYVFFLTQWLRGIERSKRERAPE
jgi:hypothetical protein